jgi:hypothetical protein
MKKLFFVIALICSFINLNAQTELKINPLGLLFLSPDVAAEFAVSENVGIEPTIGVSWFQLTVDGEKFKSTGLSYGAQGKYYFGPEKGIDKFFAGIYTRGGQSKFSNTTAGATSETFSRNRLGAGVTLGYKWVSSHNVVFELGAGIGRKIFNKVSNADKGVNVSNIPVLNLDGFFRFNVGYRFGGGNSK